MYTLISGSPKVVSSNSLYFLNIIKEKIGSHVLYELKKDNYSDIIDNIKLSHTIVLAFPLYVDSPTSITLKFLDYIIDNKINIEGKNIYVVINCGFREGEQNITACNVIKRWCEKTKCVYKGSIMIGAGEIVGKSQYKFISKKALKKLNEFSSCIINRGKCSDIVTTMDYLNNKIYCYMANSSWTKKCKKNKLSKKDVRAQ